VKPKVSLMLDSGVFSAWNKGGTLSIKDYIAYLKDYKSLLHSYVSMDVIPGEIGRKRTQSEVEESAKKSYDNLQIMKGHGLSPIPVFHQDEPFSWFERMLKDGEKYIGISSGKDLAAENDLKRNWLDTIFTMICDAKGQPLIKTHGFGITRTQYLTRYPFTTVDSTTWLLTPGFGIIIVPTYRGDKPDYWAPPIRIPVTGIAQKSTTQQKLQLEGLNGLQFDCVAKFLRDEVGVSVGEARYGTGIRRKAVLIYFMRLAEHLLDIRFVNKSSGFITKTKSITGKPLAPAPLKIMFATAMNNPEWSQMLTDNDANTRLVSYFETRNISQEKFEAYVKNGVIKKYQRRVPRQLDWNETYLNYRYLAQLARYERLEKEYGMASQVVPDAKG
jgi:hypothetical protein